tara:strand:- start:226 stop:540 length:315 start_codon:yes stop_codon:yes gene_type:complete
MTKPITPDDIITKKRHTIPDFVFQAFNEMIVEEWGSNSATFKQDKVLTRIVKLSVEQNSRTTRSKIIKNRWLDIEDIYRESGWTVVYDSPAYCETYPATFKFSK